MDSEDPEEELRRRERERGELPTGKPRRIRPPNPAMPITGAWGGSEGAVPVGPGEVANPPRVVPVGTPTAPPLLPATPQPSQPDLTKIPGRKPQPPPPPDDPASGPRPGRETRDSSVLIGIGVALIVLWAFLQLGQHTSSTTSVPTEPAPPPPAASVPSLQPGPSSTGNSGSVPVPAPAPAPASAPPARPVQRWSHAITLPINTTFGLDDPTPNREANSGFDVTLAPGTSGESLVGDGAGIAPWPGRRAPSPSECSSGSSGDHAPLGPGGVPVGGWICARSQAGNVLRFRYDGGDPTSGYRFFVTVWDGSTVQ